MALALVVVVEPAKREGSGHRDAQTFDPLPADPDVYTHAATYTQLAPGPDDGHKTADLLFLQKLPPSYFGCCSPPFVHC